MFTMAKILQCFEHSYIDAILATLQQYDVNTAYH